MVILMVGAGRVGAGVLGQLRKNPDLTVVTADSRERPYAVRQGLIERVDIREAFTPLTMAYVLDQARPDLILLTTTTEDMGLGAVPGMDILTDALREEMAALCDLPVIEVTRTRI
jgi:hypothetical protein